MSLNQKSNYYYILKKNIFIFFFLHIKKIFFVETYNNVNSTTHKLRLIAGKRGIKNYKNMSRERLLSTLDESECNFKYISQNRFEQIAKMQNFSQNELEQITKMQKLSQNGLEQIAKMRRIKNYKSMSKEELLIALLKSKQSHAELCKSKSNNVEIEETKNILVN